MFLAALAVGPGVAAQDDRLVAVLDADKEGFLRSRTSLIQTSGRAARNIDGRVIFYGDVITGSMKKAIEETGRRRELQKEYNEAHGITPTSIKKEVKDILNTVYEADYVTIEVAEGTADYEAALTPRECKRRIDKLRKNMLAAAHDLDFEKAAKLRDDLFKLEKRMLETL